MVLRSKYLAPNHSKYRVLVQAYEIQLALVLHTVGDKAEQQHSNGGDRQSDRKGVVVSMNGDTDKPYAEHWRQI